MSHSRVDAAKCPQHVCPDAELWTLPGRKWKWRMRGAALEFARRFEEERPEPVGILVTSLTNAAELRGLLDQFVVTVFGSAGPLEIAAPVHLLHGMNDEEVPWQTVTRTAACLTGEHVELSIVKAAGHRFSEPDQLALLRRALDAMLARITDASNRRA